MSHGRRHISQRQRWRILKRDGFRCRYCGTPSAAGIALVIDHAVSVYDGGNSDDGNLVSACQACNASKGRQSHPPLPTPHHYCGPDEWWNLRPGEKVIAFRQAIDASKFPADVKTLLDIWCVASSRDIRRVADALFEEEDRADEAVTNLWEYLWVEDNWSCLLVCEWCFVKKFTGWEPQA